MCEFPIIRHSHIHVSDSRLTANLSSDFCLFRAPKESISAASAWHNADAGSQLLYRVLRVSENAIRQSSLQTTGRGMVCLHHTGGCCT